MAAKAVVFNGTRLNDSDSNTGWGNFNVGGGAPASESANAYQLSTGSASSVGVVGKKVISTTTRQGVDYNGSAVNYTSAANRLFYCKVYVTDSFDLNATFGVEVAMGSADTSNYHSYNLAGSSAALPVYQSYPSQGGYIITAIDPTIDAWAETADNGGAFNQAAVTWYALGAQFQNGFAKAENVSFDAIDYGTGMTITGGDGADPDGTFGDFLATDQDTRNNRWGVVVGRGSSITARGILSIGSATATEFTDTTSIVTFPDGYHGPGLFGINVDLSNASTVVQIDSTVLSNGSRNGSDALDTRADFTVTGTSGSLVSKANLRNHRNITLTSGCDLDGADIECQLLTQGSANISNSTIRTNSLSGVACIQDPSFGTSTLINNCTFVQSGVGHAIELDTATSYSLTNIKFDGYGADASSSSAIYVSATSGTVTINVLDGGDGPTYTSAGATVVINNSVNVSIEVLDLETGSPIQDARVYLTASSGGPLSVGTVIISTLTDVNGLAENSGFSFVSAQPVTGVVRKSTGSPFYKEGKIIGTITSAGFSATIPMSKDE